MARRARDTAAVMAMIVVMGMAGGLTLTACTTGGHGLPSISDSSGPTSPGAQEAVALAYHACMSDAGLPVELIRNVAGDLTIVGFIQQHNVDIYYDEGYGRMEFGPLMLPQDRSRIEAAIEAAQQARSQEVLLFVDAIDHSGSFARCLEQTGYDPTAAEADAVVPGFDLDTLTRQVRANNRWAACARDHGWMMVSDSALPDKPLSKANMDQWPTVTLPGTMTAVELRQLLDDCPHYDLAGDQALRELWAEDPDADWPETILPDPNIGFSIPPEIAGVDLNGTLSPDQEQASLHWSNLYDIRDQVYRDAHDAQ